MKILRRENEIEEQNRTQIIANQRKNYDSLLKRIDNLIQLYISPENAHKELLDEGEFKEQKNTLIKEKTSLEVEMRHTEERVNEWLELNERTYNFATYAKVWFEKGDY